MICPNSWMLFHFCVLLIRSEWSGGEPMVFVMPDSLADDHLIGLASEASGSQVSIVKDLQPQDFSSIVNVATKTWRQTLILVINFRVEDIRKEVMKAVTEDQVSVAIDVREGGDLVQDVKLPLDSKLVLYHCLSNERALLLQEIFSLTNNERAVKSHYLPIATLHASGKGDLPHPKQWRQRRAKVLHEATFFFATPFHLDNVPIESELLEDYHVNAPNAYPPTSIIFNLEVALSEHLNLTLLSHNICKSSQFDAGLPYCLWQEFQNDSVADLLDGSFGITSNFSEEITFSQMVSGVKLHVFTLHTTERAITLSGFSGMFTPHLWLATLGLILLFSLMFTLHEQWVCGRRNGGFLFTFLAWLSTLSLILIQRSSIDLLLTKGSKCHVMFMRLLVLLASLTAFILFSIYTSMLTSQLTVRTDVESPFSRLETFLDKQNKLKVSSFVTIQWLKSAVHGRSADLASFIGTLNEEAIVYKAEEVKSFLVEHPRSAWIGSEEAILSIQWPKSPQILSLQGIPSFIYYSGIAMKQKSGLRPIFDYYLMKYREAGLIIRSRRQWKERKIEINHGATSSEMSPTQLVTLGMSDVSIPFIILITGSVASLLLTLCEMAINRVITHNRHPIIIIHG